jgi:hypothetical protein
MWCWRSGPVLNSLLRKVRISFKCARKPSDCLASSPTGFVSWFRLRTEEKPAYLAYLRNRPARTGQISVSEEVSQDQVVVPPS